MYSFLVLAIMLLLTDNRAEPIPSPGNTFRRSLSLSFPMAPMSLLSPRTKAVVPPPATYNTDHYAEHEKMASVTSGQILRDSS